LNITEVLWYEDYHTVNSQTLQIFLFITINLMLSSRNLNCLRYDDYLTKILSLVFKYHMHLTESSFLKNVMLQFYMSSPTFSYISCPRYFSEREISIRKCTLKVYVPKLDLSSSICRSLEWKVCKEIMFLSYIHEQVEKYI